MYVQHLQIFSELDDLLVSQLDILIVQLDILIEDPAVPRFVGSLMCIRREVGIRLTHFLQSLNETVHLLLMFLGAFDLPKVPFDRTFAPG
ncbi:hypothetical protein ADK77_33315 [Streptomyces antibioticus]|nr:hypothetical protein ADK77_33315 [Streptomyces antibioticus]